MKTNLQSSILFLFLFFNVNLFGQKIATKLKGRIFDKDCKQIVIYPVTEDLNNILFSYEKMTIPVVNNRFEYTLKSDHIQLYYLAFVDDAKAGYLGGNKRFFNDADVIEFELYPDNFREKNSITGGKYTNQLQEWNRRYDAAIYGRKIDSLIKKKSFYTKEYHELTDKINKIGFHNPDKILRKRVDSLRQIRSDLGDNLYTVYGRELSDKIDKVYSELSDEKEKYILNHDDILAYSLVYHSLKLISQKQIDNKKDSVLQNKIEQGLRFIKLYPGHPYSVQLDKRFNKLRVGSHYIDFTAPDIEGNMISLSSQIEGKVAILDLWGSWCGGCIITSRELIPVYEKYKEKGFVVVGLAMEYHNTKSFIHAIERDKYPWLNLIDLDRKIGVWDKYGVSSYAGAILLIDKSGKILAINPKIEEIEKTLEKLLD